ncbi:hypothetical protein ACP70R_046002 [Stipagrostis hirtigluma subsp. patula]
MAASDSDPSAAAGGVTVGTSSPSSAPSSARLRESLAALSQGFDSGDTAASDAATNAVSDILDASAAAAAEAADIDDPARSDAAARAAEELLREVHAFLSSLTSSQQMAIDALSLVLPKPVAKLGALGGSCRAVAATIIKFFVANCSPRDMLSIFCEALDTPMELPNGLAYFVLLLNGLAEVLALIQRRHVQQVEVVLPAVLKVMHATVSECDEEHGKDAVDVFNAAVGIGNAIQEMCKAMVNRNKKDLCDILGLYSLQNIALVSRSKQQDILSACGPVVLQYARVIKFCGFTYLDLLTGNGVKVATDKLSKGEDADFADCFSFVMDGATLSVVWTFMYDDMTKYAGAELELALNEVQDNHTNKWEAITMLKYVLSSISYPWIIKSHSINLLLTLAQENHTEEMDHVDFTSCAPRTFATLKAIESVMMFAPEAVMRKKAFAALKKVISMVPSSQRFDILQALIKNSVSSSLTGILLDLVREEVVRESRRADEDCVASDGLQDHGESPHWASHALELVELILRPPEGGPPRLPDHNEQVLSALNLLRLIMIIDSRGSRLGRLLREETLQKVHSEWLIPLRPVVAGIQSENEKDDSEIANQIVCSLNPVQLVLYHCIELVEEKMKG